MQFNRRTLLYLNLFTLIGFSGIGIAEMYFFQDKTPLEFFRVGCPLWRQFLQGAFLGFSALIAALLIIKTPRFKDARIFFTGHVAAINPAVLHILFYSFCTAVGEEILFRGTVQHYLGIWPTSVIVIAIHGFINFKKPSILLYGLLMIVVCSLFGYLYQFFGIYAAILAHFIFDTGMFLFYRRNVGRE